MGQRQRHVGGRQELRAHRTNGPEDDRKKRTMAVTRQMVEKLLALGVIKFKIDINSYYYGGYTMIHYAHKSKKVNGKQYYSNHELEWDNEVDMLVFTLSEMIRLGRDL